MGNGNQSRKSIAQMLSGAFDQGETARMQDSELFGELAFDEPSSLADQWFDVFVNIMDMYPEELLEELGDVHYGYAVTKVYGHGEIHGTVKAGPTTYRVFVRGDGESPPAACNCPQSQGEFPCMHSLAFVDHVTDELDDERSRLTRRINSGNFNTGQPVRPDAIQDDPNEVLNQLDELVKFQENNLSVGGQAPDDSLPEVRTKIDQRICWDFVYEDRLSVEPYLQQRKKRGDGFTKGKKLSLEKLLSDHKLPLSKVDRQVADCIEADDYYYRRLDYSLNPFEAVTSLVGCANITFNGDPCVIRERPIVVSLVVSDDKFSFGLSDEHGQPIRCPAVVGPETLVVLDAKNHTLFLSQNDPERINLMRQLISTAAFKKDQLSEVIAKVKPLQKHLNLRLPVEFAGQHLVEEAPLVLLLRSQSDGSLDYGIRIRDAAGALRRPGADPMIAVVEREGQPFQVQRLSDNERSRAETLADSLGVNIDHKEWFGTISDFRLGLSLIETLQSGDLDVEVLWDEKHEKPISVLGNLSSKNVRVDITSKRNWFGVTGECDFGDGKTKMPLSNLLDSLSAVSDDAIQGDFLKLGDGQWARISKKLRERLKKLRDATHSDRSTLKLDATSAPAIRDLMDSDVQVKAAKSWQKCLTRLGNAEKLDPQLPAGLDATLRDYQIDGYKWLRRLAEWGVGGILADDMGLGKTLQTLAVLLDRSSDGPALVIAPTSVGFNWVREAERFTPDLNVHLYRETERGDFLPTVGPGDLVICSYGLALRDAEALASVEWGTLVMDEAQAIKNSRSKTSKAIASVGADWTIALTGTPVENHLGELWSLFHVVSPGVFGGWEQFRKRYATPIEKQGDEKARMALAERLQPFVLRRTKSEVLTELPPRTEMNLYVDLSKDERAEYEKVRLAALGEVEQIESLPQIQDQRFKILALLTRLRQISCHAGLVNENWTESSAKLDQLCETLKGLKAEGHRALIFSQFTKHLALIRKALDERGFTYEYLDGSTPAEKRQQAVDRFQEGNADAFLISLKAGGTGLNLTAADYVIHMDPWWNPAVEDQATDRAHRIGQDKPVMVYRIIAKGTIEEEILALHESKRDLVAGVMQGTEAAAKLSNDDLIRMLRG